MNKLLILTFTLFSFAVSAQTDSTRQTVAYSLEVFNSDSIFLNEVITRSNQNSPRPIITNSSIFFNKKDDLIQFVNQMLQQADFLKTKAMIIIKEMERTKLIPKQAQPEDKKE